MDLNSSEDWRWGWCQVTSRESPKNLLVCVVYCDFPNQWIYQTKFIYDPQIQKVCLQSIQYADTTVFLYLNIWTLSQPTYLLASQLSWHFASSLPPFYPSLRFPPPPSLRLSAFPIPTSWLHRTLTWPTSRRLHNVKPKWLSISFYGLRWQSSRICP